MGVEAKKMASSLASAGGDFGDKLKSWPERIKGFYGDVRTEMKKFCPRCRKHTAHKETK